MPRLISAGVMNRIWDIPVQQERLDCGTNIARHRHGSAYAAVILSGGYYEAGDAGRWHVGPGDALIHEPFESHKNLVEKPHTAILNMALPADHNLPSAFHISDLDAFVRLAGKDLQAALALLQGRGGLVPSLNDWPDMLAALIKQSPDQSIHHWAEEIGINPSTVSRGFRKAFGVSPSRYRLEYRARKAWKAILETSNSLCDIALQCGFSDQAHMTRSVALVTGATPSIWRKIKYVQYGG